MEGILKVKVTKKLKNNWSLVLVTAFLLIALCYVLICGENIYIQVHDNLDSNVAGYKVLKDNGIFWSWDAIVSILGGIDRFDYFEELSFYAFLYMIFPTFWAYVAGYFLSDVIAVAGAVFLGKTILKESYDRYKHIIILCGFVFGLMPVFPTLSFSFVSMPFLLGILYRLYESDKKIWILAILFYPLASNFPTVGIFLCGYLLVFIIMDAIVKRRVKWNFVLALLALCVGYVVTNYRLFYTMFASGEETIRASFTDEYISFVEAIKKSGKVFLLGHYHSGSLHTYVILPVVMICLIVCNIGYVRRHQAKKILTDKLNWIFCWIVFNSACYGLNDYRPFKEAIETVFPVLSGFNFNRTLWTNPFLWSLSFAIALCRFSDWLRNRRELQWKSVGNIEGNLVLSGSRNYFFLYVILVAAIAVECFVSTDNSVYNDISLNIKNQFLKANGQDVTDLTYAEFYSEDLFDELLEDIGYNGEYSIAYGFHPAILTYNGISTLDGYYTNYSQEYKEQFQALIAPELAVNESWRNYYNSWGGRAYVPSTELGYKPADALVEPEPVELLIDIDVFQEMGGTYVFSRAEISNADELGLELLGTYTDDGSPYTMRVYDIVE